jgi:hypothetical protein
MVAADFRQAERESKRNEGARAHISRDTAGARGSSRLCRKDFLCRGARARSCAVRMNRRFAAARPDARNRGEAGLWVWVGDEPDTVFSRRITTDRTCGSAPRSKWCIMRVLGSLSLTALAVVGLTVVPPAFNGGAIAATAQAKPAHHAGPAQSRVARSACRPIRASTGQVIAALLSQPPSIPPQPLYVNGQRVCVDWAHPFYQWSDGSTSAAPPERPPPGWR